MPPYDIAPPEPPRSLRRAYLEWVEERIEEYKDTVPRGQLLDLADEVCRELRVDDQGQYQITEILLCTAMDRRIFRTLRLPGYRAWCRDHGEAALAAVRASAPTGEEDGAEPEPEIPDYADDSLPAAVG